MTERSFDEMIAYFNRRVADMDIAQDYKMELLGMVTALGFKHEKSVQPEIIRCKDCKWFDDIGCAIRIVDDTDKPSEEDYCSFAERKTNGTDAVAKKLMGVGE